MMMWHCTPVPTAKLVGMYVFINYFQLTLCIQLYFDQCQQFIYKFAQQKSLLYIWPPEVTGFFIPLPYIARLSKKFLKFFTPYKLLFTLVNTTSSIKNQHWFHSLIYNIYVRYCFSFTISHYKLIIIQKIDNSFRLHRFNMITWVIKRYYIIEFRCCIESSGYVLLSPLMTFVFLWTLILYLQQWQ
eukprot:TRINITY_DN5663_c0_g2_i2.p1 TRINITY_DN5663_c0_g2~~TRINITY_DN5663_c0_g2_i2.p1  ORF type:complete len:186 (-),score=-17.99 TRINITY_DN5663_c0_g2_i2:224-781(-)